MNIHPHLQAKYCPWNRAANKTVELRKQMSLPVMGITPGVPPGGKAVPPIPPIGVGVGLTMAHNA